MQKDKKVILVTGAAGFIGYHLCSKLISPKNTIIGFDNPFGIYFDSSQIYGPIFGGMIYAGLRLKV